MFFLFFLETGDSQISNGTTTTLFPSQQSFSDWEAEIISERDKFNKAMHILSSGKATPLQSQLNLPWKSVSRSTKAMYLKICSEAVDLVLQHIVPGQVKEVFVDLAEKQVGDVTESQDVMTSALIKAYLDQNNSQTQIQILSLFAHKFTKQKLTALIPGLTISRIDAARRHASFEKPGQIINPPRIYRMRLSKPKLMHFIEFISSPTYHQAVGYGSKTLQLSSGLEMKIPKVVRNIISSRLINTYLAYCQDQSYETFSRSTLYNILNACNASQKKNLHGLDNITADGMKAIDNIAGVISKLRMFGLEEEKAERLNEVMISANQHLKFEIKGHLATESKCIDHCTVFSLSDPNSQEFRGKCNHEHCEGCSHCSIVEKSLIEVTDTFESMTSIPSDLVAEMNHDITRSKEQILAWKAHCVRTVHQDQAKQDALCNMKPHQALIVMDFAMKFLPVKHRDIN